MKKVCLIKCCNKDMHKDEFTNEDFTRNVRDYYGNTVCDWCYWMWGV